MGQNLLCAKKYFGFFWLTMYYQESEYVAEAKFGTYKSAERFLEEHLIGYSYKVVKEVTA